jgi:hypothetical protein
MEMNRTDIINPDLDHANDILDCLRDGARTVSVKITKKILGLLRDAISEAGRNGEIRPITRWYEDREQPDVGILKVWLINEQGEIQ